MFYLAAFANETLMLSKLLRLSQLSFLVFVEILLKTDFYNELFNIRCHNLQDLEGASC